MKSVSNNSIDGITERRLLQSVVGVARHVYAAAASSVFMVDRDTGELTFAAVAGTGQQGLVGMRFPAGTGIAGWVASSCQTLIADDVSRTDRFARDAAASTGFLPSSIMAAPLLVDGECVGVLEVLDRGATGPDGSGRDLDDLEMLDLLAVQAALGLALLRRRQVNRVAPPIGSLVERLSDYAAMDSTDPLAVALLGVSLDLLERGAPES